MPFVKKYKERFENIYSNPDFEVYKIFYRE